MHPTKRIIIVAVPILLRRAIATMGKHYPDRLIQGSSPTLPLSQYDNPFVLDRLCGEIDRLKKYAEKGDILPVTIPDLIKETCDYLRSKT
ncbi:MAG: hypothetical protein HQ402_03145 [Parcubacteria group bacterium]|nr:hypothetical protein [Parcubacteria group bacterium]